METASKPKRQAPARNTAQKRPRLRVSEGEIRRRQSILAAARRLIARVGYENFTMQDLAAESGVALGTLYNYYQGKEDIAGAAYEEQHGLVFSRLERDDAHRGIERLFFVVESVAESLKGQQVYAREMLTKYPANSHGAATRAVRARTYRRGVLEMREDGVLLDWVKVDFLAWHLTELLQLPLLGWIAGNIPEGRLGAYGRYLLCTALDGMTAEPLRERLSRLARELAEELGDLKP
jgi:AcrR family transcriptional regulator